MATVIKVSSAHPTADVASFNFDDLGDRAKDYLDQVRRQAAEILHAAEREAGAIRARAEAQAESIALEAADRILDQRVARQMTTLVPALRDAVNGITSAKAEWLLHWEQMAVHVAAAIAARVIRREVERTPEITLALVKEALELAGGSGDVRLRMHPDDLQALGKQVALLADELARVGKPQIVADPQITKGSCRIDTRFGVIDQQFEAQLARIEQELT